MGKRKYPETGRLDDSQRALVEENSGLVYSIAKKYSQSKETRQELVQEGNLGLIDAVQRYDAEDGKFSTFASHWIRGYMLKHMCDNRTATISQRDHWLIRKIHSFMDDRYKMEGRYPDSDEIAKEFSSEGKEYSAREIEGMLAGMLIRESLDSPLDDSEGSKGSRHDIMGEDATQEEDSHKGKLKKKLNSYLNELSADLPDDRRDITMRIMREHYGEDRDLSDIAADCGRSLETVRKLHEAAIRKLKVMISEDRKGKDLMDLD